MNIIYTKSYDKTYKELKKYPKEKANLEEILELIRISENFNQLISNPFTKMYQLERLKYNLNKFYSLNPSKSGGKIRLIIRPVENEVEVELIYISYDHYKDFNEKKVIYYEKK